MASLEKMHILVYSRFFLAVIRLGVFYRPGKFRSHPPLRMPARSEACIAGRSRKESSALRPRSVKAERSCSS